MTGNDTKAMDAGDPHVELRRVLRLCHPGWESLGRLTFSSKFSTAADWGVWCEAVFLPLIHPALEGAFAAASRGDARAVAECDAALDAALPGDLAGTSRRAGRRLAEDYTAPNAEKLWLRYRDRILSEKVPGHFAVMLAIRAAAFHLSPGSLASALLFLEARGGMPDVAMNDWVRMVSDGLPKERVVRLRAA